jgi:hypothetical protein
MADYDTCHNWLSVENLNLFERVELTDEQEEIVNRCINSAFPPYCVNITKEDFDKIAKEAEGGRQWGFSRIPLTPECDQIGTVFGSDSNRTLEVSLVSPCKLSCSCSAGASGIRYCDADGVPGPCECSSEKSCVLPEIYTRAEGCLSCTDIKDRIIELRTPSTFGYDRCEEDADCIVIGAETDCERPCNVVIAAEFESDYVSRLEQISTDYCQDSDYKYTCGIVPYNCPPIKTTCNSGRCIAIQ